jgi:hypothetical protein
MVLVFRERLCARRGILSRISHPIQLRAGNKEVSCSDRRETLLELERSGRSPTEQVGMERPEEKKGRDY